MGSLATLFELSGLGCSLISVGRDALEKAEIIEKIRNSRYSEFSAVKMDFRKKLANSACFGACGTAPESGFVLPGKSFLVFRSRVQHDLNEGRLKKQ